MKSLQLVLNNQEDIQEMRGNHALLHFLCAQNEDNFVVIKDVMGNNIVISHLSNELGRYSLKL